MIVAPCSLVASDGVARFGNPRGLAVDRAECAAERIEHQPLHRRDSAGRQLVERNVGRKPRQALRFCQAAGR